MRCLVELDKLLTYNDIVYLSDYFYTKVNGISYSFMKGLLCFRPNMYQHKKFNVNIDSPGCYLIRCLNTGKIYVGSTRSVYKRVVEHKGMISKRLHHNSNFQDILKVSSIADFELIVFFTEDREIAYDLEQFFVDHYRDSDVLINIANDVRMAMKGHVFTEEHKRKISEANKGRELSLVAREKISLSRKNSEKAINQLADVHTAKQRPVSINNIVYESITEAVKATGLSDAWIRKKGEEENSGVFFLAPPTSKMSGRELSVDHRSNISAARKNSEKAKAQFATVHEKNGRKVTINGVAYKNIIMAAETSGMSESNIHKQIRKKYGAVKMEHYYLDYKHPVPRKLIRDGIIFDSIRDAARKLGVERGTVKNWLRKGTISYYD